MRIKPIDDWLGYRGKHLPIFPRFVFGGTELSRAAWPLKARLLPPVYWKGMPRGGGWLAKPRSIAATAK